jgi:sulfate permease
MIAPFFGIGSSMMGYRVIKTTGKEIIQFGPLGATLISVITATLLLLASTTRGIPTSLVQMNTGAILGLGVSKIGWKAIKNDTPLGKIVTIWIVAPLIAMAISTSLTILADYLGMLKY